MEGDMSLEWVAHLPVTASIITKDRTTNRCRILVKSGPKICN